MLIIIIIFGIQKNQTTDYDEVPSCPKINQFSDICQSCYMKTLTKESHKGLSVKTEKIAKVRGKILKPKSEPAGSALFCWRKVGARISIRSEPEPESLT